MRWGKIWCDKEKDRDARDIGEIYKLRNFVRNILKKEDFGKLRIDKVKQSDAKAWLIKLQKDGRG